MAPPAESTIARAIGAPIRIGRANHTREGTVSRRNTRDPIPGP
jgi:hypothetical protein